MNLQNMFGLDGRIALVTGGSRGIGKMIVEGYLAAGAARVYISARKTAQIEEAAALLGRDPAERGPREPREHRERDPRHTPQFLHRSAGPQRAMADDEFEDD